MPPAVFVPVALLVLIAGAAYCLGYDALQRGTAIWHQGLLWSACAVLPWLIVLEFIKRREWSGGRTISWTTIAAILLLTGAGSLACEWVSDRWLFNEPSWPLALQVLRRVPAIAATVLLLLLSRRDRALSRNRSPTISSAEDIEALVQHAPAIHWIRAADNYLELHLEGQVWTKRVTMREASELLKPLGFVRVHRSYMVNRNHVAEVFRRQGEAALRMTDGTDVPTGKAFSDNLKIFV